MHLIFDMNVSNTYYSLCAGVEAVIRDDVRLHLIRYFERASSFRVYEYAIKAMILETSILLLFFLVISSTLRQPQIPVIYRKKSPAGFSL